MRSLEPIHPILGSVQTRGAIGVNLKASATTIRLQKQCTDVPLTGPIRYFMG